METRNYVYNLLVGIFLVTAVACSNGGPPWDTYNVIQFDTFYVLVSPPLTGYIVRGTYPQHLPEVDSLFVGLNLQYVIERAVIETNGIYSCRAPNEYFAAPEDPLTNNTNYGYVYSYIDVSRLETTTYNVTEYINETLTIQHLVFDSVDSVTLASFQTNFSVITGGSYSYPLSADTTHTGGQIPYAEYWPNGVKVSLRVKDYPFQKSSGSYIALSLNYTVGVLEQTILTYGGVNGDVLVQLESPGGLPLMLSFDQFSFFDDVPYIQPVNFNFSIPASGTNYTAAFLSTYRFCFNESWTTLFWDPHMYAPLSGAFAPPVSPLAPPNSPAVKQRNLGRIAAIVVGIVVLLVISFVLLAVYVKPIRHLIRPFAKRQAQHHTIQ